MDPTSYGVDQSRLQATQVCDRQSIGTCFALYRIASECETIRPFAVYDIAFLTADDRGDRPTCTNGTFSAELLELQACRLI